MSDQILYDPQLMAAMSDIGWEVKKDEESDYFLFSSIHECIESPATFETPDEAAEACLEYNNNRQ
jgi:hypothetical protein